MSQTTKPEPSPSRLSQPLRVFQILSNPGVGGIEGMLSNLIPRFDRSICDVGVINMRTSSKAYDLFGRCGVPCIKLPTPGKMLLGSVLSLARALRRERADVIETYGLRASLIGRLAARIAGVPVCIQGVLSTDNWRRWYHVALDRMTSANVDAWIANSCACKQALLDREKFPAQKIHVIYDGVDVDAWRPDAGGETRQRLRREFGVDGHTVLCVTVANLRHAKGHPYMIEALADILVKAPDTHFLMVGADNLNGQIQARARELGIERAITFAGFRSDIQDIYQGADVAVLPSLWEGLPICLIEAMAMELPVVSTRVSGIPELVQDGVTGLVVPPADSAALAQAIVHVATNSAIRRSMGQAGRDKVVRQFSIERMVRQLEDIYVQLWQKSQAKRG